MIRDDRLFGWEDTEEHIALFFFWEGEVILGRKNFWLMCHFLFEERTYIPSTECICRKGTMSSGYCVCQQVTMYITPKTSIETGGLNK